MFGPSIERLKEIIARAVRGKPSSWPIDPAFPPTGNFEADFNAGDKQALLWAIHDAATKEVPIPKWAAEALDKELHQAVTGKYESWDDVFGPLFAKATQQRGIRTKARMFDVEDRIDQIHEEEKVPINDLLFERVGKELGVGGKTTTSNLYKDAREASACLGGSNSKFNCE
jgi:hypothetical protein